MAMVDLAGVHKVTAKGRTYYYAWRGGPRIEADPSDVEAFAQELADHRRARKGGDPSRVSGLCIEWKASDVWTKSPPVGMAESTKTNWRRWVDEISDHFGQLRIRHFDRPEIRRDIKKWRDKWKDTPRAADMAKQVLSALLSFAMEEGKLSTNPCDGLSNLYSADRAEIIWTDDDLAHHAKTASIEIMFALRLACLTGLRQGDLLTMEPKHVSALAIEKKSDKSQGALGYLVPMYGELRALLNEIDAHWDQQRAERIRAAEKAKKPLPLIQRSTILFNSDLRAWTKGGFGSSWNKSCWAALGLKPRQDGKTLEDAGWELHFHDARGTAATKFYLARSADGERVFSIEEIAEILAWSVKRVEGIIKRYVTKDALLRDRIRRMDEARENASGTEGVKPAVKPEHPTGVGKN